MFYTVYKIINLINNKIYVGAHSTNDINDSYMGSGLAISRAKEKYGIENFKKEILFLLDSSEEMYEKEKEIVNEDFVKRKDTYNMKLGGNGGWDYVNECKSEEDRQDISRLGGIAYANRLKIDEEFKNYISNIRREAGQLRYKNGDSSHLQYDWTGKKHKEETKQKIGAANSISVKGEGNSQFGTMWIYNLELKQNKKIKNNEIIPNGWIKGRKMKF